MALPDTHLHIDGISKQFGTVRALQNVDLKIERGSFVCLLGPSGCGKTTLLRIIAGFEDPSAGRLMLDGTDISKTPPHKRGFGMVFQSLALFPHMSVADSISYGLKLRGVSGSKRRERVDELLQLIELPSIADRPVSALSGGQRQRVAIARALAIQPPLFLLDEPLSALDAKLRDNIQVELRQLQRKFGFTTILVTHDQHEAMMLADQLVVMKQGEIRQSDDPTAVYRQPVDTFVADFLGSANVLKATVTDKGFIHVLGADTSVKSTSTPGTQLEVALRAEQLGIVPVGSGESNAVGTVAFVRDPGASLEWVIIVGEEKLRVRTSANAKSHPEICQTVDVRYNPENLAVFSS